MFLKVACARRLAVWFVALKKNLTAGCLQRSYSSFWRLGIARQRQIVYAIRGGGDGGQAKGDAVIAMAPPHYTRLKKRERRLSIL